ncbi:MAG: hypothetical protein CUN55_10615 [Phototrophicales bacterium]|nr:MAG: hypothetical protein CUN55_10615 [Phototrophicales bacterium]
MSDLDQQLSKPISDDDIITPEQAEDILRPEVQRLQAEGWRIVNKPLYGVRMERGIETLDLYVDLLGNIERKTTTTIWTSAFKGRLVAWMLLLVSLLGTLALASALGLLD